MERLSPEVFAAVVAAEIAQAHRNEISDALREEIAERFETALRRIARQERDACVAQCLERQAMWEATEARSTIAEPLRQEARARCNEAAVIADALRAANATGA
jgi:transposase